MEDFNESDYSSESEQITGIISVPIFRVRSNFALHTTSMVSVFMENFYTLNNSIVIGRSTLHHRTTRAMSLLPDSSSSDIDSTESSSDESSSDSGSLSPIESSELRMQRYSTDSESTWISSDDTSSSSSNSSSPSSDEPSTSTGRRRQYLPMPNGHDSDASEGVPPNKRTRSDDGNGNVPYNCPVCLEDVREREPVSTTCGHVFCKKCIERAVANGRMCPLCGVEPRFHRIFL